MLSFVEYASEKRILELLIKERVKVALKGKLQNISPTETYKKSDDRKTVAEQIFLLMPPRDSWLRPQKKERIDNSGEKRSGKQVLTRSIALTIKKHRKSPGRYPYLQRLDTFISTVRNDIMGDAPLIFNSIKVMGKKKKVDEMRVTIMRPICIFESLREKLLIALASKYLSEAFDPLLHEEILSYRPLRKYHGSSDAVFTDRDNAIENMQIYRNARRRQHIYVAECDIQKYFDTINHDVIRCCFSKFAEELNRRYCGFKYRSVERILDAYLNSYSFYKNVAIENDSLLNSAQPRMYESPKECLFIERGCYTQEEFNASVGKIGIPQGGALSGLISNVVLCCVDKASILLTDDGERFFCRYGDDIMLMHTSKQECERLMENYRNVLTEYKLLYHTFTSVADSACRKSNGAVRPALWNLKSRNPFLWGRDGDDNEQIDWIGFLGYEIRYTGEVRMRRSSLNDKFKSVKRRYRTAAKTKIAKGKCAKKGRADVEREILNRLEKFKVDGFATAKSLNRNKYCMTQALKLDRYASRLLYRLLYKIACKNNLTKEKLACWWEKAKGLGCISYRRSLDAVTKRNNSYPLL